MENLLETIKTKTMKNLLETIKQQNIAHSIGVNLNTFKVSSLNRNSRDYFLMIHKKDLTCNLKGFYKDVDYENLMIADLTDVEINYFKENLSDYDKIQHDEDGRIYEQKNKSFKKYFKSNQ